LDSSEYHSLWESEMIRRHEFNPNVYATAPASMSCHSLPFLCYVSFLVGYVYKFVLVFDFVSYVVPTKVLCIGN
jgi:hypothetical protein